MSDAIFDHPAGVPPVTGRVHNVVADGEAAASNGTAGGASRPAPPAGLPILACMVVGTPAPQGSHKAFIAGGRAVITHDSKKTRPWRQDVKFAVLDAAGSDGTPAAGPLEVDVTFALARPKSHYRTGRNAHLLRDGAPVAPAGKPDIDKLLRSTLDGLGEGGVWVDDSQVVGVVARKTYAGGDNVLLPRPGAFIVVRRVA